MNKKILLTILLCVLALPCVTMAWVAPTSSPSSSLSISELVTDILDLMWVIVSAIAVIMFVVAGILFLTASGKPEQLTTARNALIWGVVGIVVAIVGFSIVTIIKGYFA